MEQTNEFFLQTSLLLPQVHFYIATSWKVGNRQGRKRAPQFEYSSSLCKFKASHVHMIKGLRTHEHSVCMSAVEGGRGWAEDKGWCLLIWWDFTQSCSYTEVNVRPNCREDWIVSDEQNAFKSACLHNEPRMAFAALILIFVDISHRHCRSPQAVIQLNYEETHYFFHMVSFLRVELDWKKSAEESMELLFSCSSDEWEGSHGTVPS